MTDARLLNAERLTMLAESAGVDAAIATSPENVTYSSGYWALSQWIRRGPQVYVLLPMRDIDGAAIVTSTSLLDLVADQTIWVKNVRRYGYFQADRADVPLGGLDRRQADLYALADEQEPIAALAAAVHEAGLSKARIAVDELGLVPGAWERLKDALPGATLIPGTELFRQTRAVKTQAEITRLRQVAQITERSIAAALAVAREGATELDLARAFHAQTVREDAFPVLGCIGFGLRSAMPNVQPSDARLTRGEVIRFDVGGRYRHYRADIARIAVLGEPDAKTASYMRALHRGVERAVERIKPGVHAAEIFETAVETVRREGITHYSRSHVGHGIGIDGYDLPDLSPRSDAVIEEGMVLCVETPYYELGWCGLQVEDMLVVRADGAETLMTTDGSLVVLP